MLVSPRIGVPGMWYASGGAAGDLKRSRFAATDVALFDLALEHAVAVKRIEHLGHAELEEAGRQLAPVPG
jgi:hypothetical protein